MAHRDRVNWLLEDLCVRHGLCLPPAARLRLRQAPPVGVDAFTDAVLTAEGLGDPPPTGLRRQVRGVVERHMATWP